MWARGGEERAGRRRGDGRASHLSSPCISAATAAVGSRRGIPRLRDRLCLGETAKRRDRGQGREAARAIGTCFHARFGETRLIRGPARPQKGSVRRPITMDCAPRHGRNETNPRVKPGPWWPPRFWHPPLRHVVSKVVKHLGRCHGRVPVFPITSSKRASEGGREGRCERDVGRCRRSTNRCVHETRVS